MIHSFRLSILSLSLLLSACGTTFEGDKLNYRSATKAPALEVPPDLTQLGNNTRYTVPGGAVTAAGLKGAQASGSSTPVAVQALADARLERAGNQQWLVVNRSPEELWEPVKDFWLKSGFVLANDQMSLGFMETDWAENRAKLPQDFIRGALGKVLDALYSTGEQDKFRTRFERNGTGGTDIFISHRGMVEVYTSQQKDRTTWQSRPADPSLEAEFLRRVMLRLTGATSPTAEAAASSKPQTLSPTARATTVNNQPAIEIDDSFDRAWRRVGLSLDRTGFTVEDRDRAKGIYFVRYVESDPKQKKEPGFFAKLFSGSKPAAAPLKLRIVLAQSGNGATLVSVQNANGEPETSAVAQKIVTQLTDELK